MEKLRIELEIEEKAVYFVSVNKSDATDTQAKLVEKCSFPLFQDTPEVNAWALHGGGKDDFFIYDSQGKLAVFLPASGPISTDLSTPEGYANVKNAVLGVQ